MIEKTLLIIKPDGVKRQISGNIIQRIENTGLKIVAMKMLQIDEVFSKKHYSMHVDKDFYPFLENMITEGPVIAMVLEGVDAVSVLRKLVGDTEPKTALPGTIRGDFAHHGKEHTSENKKAIKNLVHASGNKEEAKTEIRLWFTDDEINDYKTTSEVHTF